MEASLWCERADPEVAGKVRLSRMLLGQLEWVDLWCGNMQILKIQPKFKKCVDISEIVCS